MPLREPVKAGAVAGFVEIGTARALERVLEIAAKPPSLRRAAAVKALATTKAAEPETFRVLEAAVGDASTDLDARLAVCRALALSKSADAVAPLGNILRNGSAPGELRAAAAWGLGIVGRREALPVVSAACGDGSREVALQARIARTRLEHVRAH